MTMIFVYPVPLDSEGVWFLFKPFVKRFCDTWRKFPPGADCEILVVLNNGDTTNELLEMFDGLPVTWMRYDGAGADAGSWQHASRLRPGCFMVACNTRTYFHRAGWLQLLIHFREEFGPGLYATSASHEGGKLHACIRTVGIDTDLFNKYPVDLVSRDHGCFFEIGRDNPLGCFSEWVESLGFPANVVYWSGCYEKKDWFMPDNIFRKGDQSNLLVWDKHTELWERSDLQEKSRLVKECLGSLASSDPPPKSETPDTAKECSTPDSPS